jgi:glycosyltransferase involved in cell wall biosynthesis
VAPRTPVPYPASSGVDEPVKASDSLISPSLVSADFAGVPPSAFKLVIGGTRWDNPEVTRYLKRAGISNQVIRTGFLKEEEAVAFYNYAAAFLFPSLAEGFGMPNLEAMACGCPVITSNVFAIPEVVGDAAMVLKNPLDPDALALAIWRVLYELPLRKRLIDRGLARVRQFDWDESARKVMEVYEGLAGQQ